jgi:hypothetical protein
MIPMIRYPWVDFRHPANTGLLKMLKSEHPEIEEENAEKSPDTLRSYYEELETHPDVIRRIWDEVSIDLPEDCRWIVYQRPILCHPSTGVIFGWASGTPTYALRLPEKERTEALSAGAKTTWTYNDAWTKNLAPEYNSVLNLSDWGIEWVFGRWDLDERRWCLAAYHAAAHFP